MKGMLHGVLSLGAGASETPMIPAAVTWTYLVVAACHAAALRGWQRRNLFRAPAPVLGISYGVLLTVTLILAPASGKAFIYFQF